MGINNLIARFLADKSTKEEWEQLESWKAESKENLNELMDLQSIWNGSVDLKDYESFDNTAAWDKINAEIGDDVNIAPSVTAPPLKKSNPTYLNLKWVVGIAASISLIVFAVFAMGNDEIEGFNTIAALDTIEAVELPDGSSVVINRNTDLNYAVDFENNRDVILEGEAYFDVQRDEEQPFTILTDCGTITVLGTSFNVEEKGDGVNVYVTSGSVKVNSGSEEVVLSKNDMVRCGENGIEKIATPRSNYLSWKSNKLVFDDTPLHLVIGDLSRHFGVNLSFASSSTAMNMKVLDEFQNQSFESVMESIVLITGIKYIKDENNYIIE